MALLTARFDRALVYAHKLHARQLRKQTRVPYIAHLLAVAGLVLEHGGREDETIAALLHDAIEDQGGAATRRAITRRFGARVAAIVDGCSDADVTPKPPWRGRKERYLAHLARAPRAVLLVSAADKLHNARSILADYRTLGEKLWARFNGGRDGTLWYYRALVKAFSNHARAPRALVRELERTVTELERLARAGRPRQASDGRAVRKE